MAAQAPAVPDDQGSGWAQLDSLCQASPGEYFIRLDKSMGAKLGIDVDHKATLPAALRRTALHMLEQDGETLLVEVINEGLVMEPSSSKGCVNVVICHDMEVCGRYSLRFCSPLK